MDPYLHAPHSEPIENTGPDPKIATLSPDQVELKRLDPIVTKIFKKRIGVAIVMSALWIGLGIYFYFGLANLSVQYIFIIAAAILATWAVADLIIECINLKKRYIWYSYINFLIWNVLSQISEMTIGSMRSGSRNKLIFSALKLDIPGMIQGYDGMRSAERLFDANDAEMNSTLTVDTYYTLKTRDAFDTKRLNKGLDKKHIF